MNIAEQIDETLKEGIHPLTKAVKQLAKIVDELALKVRSFDEIIEAKSEDIE